MPAGNGNNDRSLLGTKQEQWDCGFITSADNFQTNYLMQGPFRDRHQV